MVLSWAKCRSIEARASARRWGSLARIRDAGRRIARTSPTNQRDRSFRLDDLREERNQVLEKHAGTLYAAEEQRQIAQRDGVALGFQEFE